jgi:hypothetical protein
MLHHAANEGQDIHRFVLGPLGAVRAVVIRHAAAIIAIDTSDGARWGDELFRQIGGEGVIACRHVA